MQEDSEGSEVDLASTAPVHSPVEQKLTRASGSGRLPLTAFSTVMHASPKPSSSCYSDTDAISNTESGNRVVPVRKPSERAGQSQLQYLRSLNDELEAPTSLRKDITLEELKNHNTATNAWIALKGKVYDVTGYLQYHPGGSKILISSAGKDATELFKKYHSWIDADYLLSKRAVGWLQL
ncbi:hypothetical protein CEUSTIGMA_g5879.t1 [Chlamydomonas eustigma]|uniref:Cytochrome b5 heme-binding domain-containing protein n=1 Tax=Chlamydomonas eustigma TaxID=1157962 RepID=A0A250X5V2_9CHLO|nr:hypothetical protein CEUSTIGMA_g5879.t1 [Chlamydomonas eustigma]|eukprot:GAX78438.1 hypothetical protein CEUSTIGMA_g5879.t1 [Chlamydomonas eustigma]